MNKFNSERIADRVVDNILNVDDNDVADERGLIERIECTVYYRSVAKYFEKQCPSNTYSFVVEDSHWTDAELNEYDLNIKLQDAQLEVKKIQDKINALAESEDEEEPTTPVQSSDDEEIQHPPAPQKMLATKAATHDVSSKSHKKLRYREEECNPNKKK